MCTRKRCVSFISFGSACAYQIGATLSIFHAAGREWLFIPYLAVLVAALAVHNRIWYRIDQKWAAYFERRQTFLQKPSWKGIVFRVKEVLQQFIFQAMPIFLIICLAATVLNELGVIRLVTLLVSPVLSLFGAPEDAAPGLVFSLIRKDGILLFNEGNGALLDMSAGSNALSAHLLGINLYSMHGDGLDNCQGTGDENGGAHYGKTDGHFSRFGFDHHDHLEADALHF